MNVFRSTRDLVVALLVFAPAASAQLADDPRIVGWVSSPLLPASGAIQAQDVDNKCQAAKTVCTNILLNNAILHAGGTAYDPRYQSAWVSDGRDLVRVDLATCKVACKAKPSLMRQGAVFSGLAISSRRGMLYHLETTTGYLGILPWNLGTCVPTPTKGGCSMQLGSRSVAAGLAYDEVRDLLYYTITGTGPSNRLYVASPTSGCRPICSVPLPNCPDNTPLGMVTGLAFDSCRSILYVTDGQRTMRLSMVDPQKCQIRVIDCCSKQTGGGAYQGLAIIPGWKTHRFGKSCITKGCPYCPNLRVSTFGGDAEIGNREFGLEIGGGPVGSVATLAIGVGACTKGVPFLCGSLHLITSPAPILLPFGTLTGTQCAATARLKLPIPIDPSLCKLQVCLQAIARCGSTGVTYAMSDALQIDV